MYSDLSMKMGWLCSFVGKGITSSDVLKLKLDKFNLERSNFLAARIIKHWNKLVGGRRQLPLLGIFKTTCVVFLTHFDPAAEAKIYGFCLWGRLMGHSGPTVWQSEYTWGESGSY